jgi:hypothetical protein
MRVHRREPVATTPPQKLECGPGPATPDRIARVSLTCHGRREDRRNEGFHRQRQPKRVPRLRSLVTGSPSRDGGSQPHGGQQPFFCSEEQKGEKATSRASALLEAPSTGHSLSRIAGSTSQPQSFGPARNFHVSLDTLSVTSWRAAIPKTGCTVKKLWRMRLPCGRPRKSQTESSTPLIHSKCFQSLTQYLRGVLGWIANVGK